jgi:hypothetical protein
MHMQPCTCYMHMTHVHAHVTCTCACACTCTCACACACTLYGGPARPSPRRRREPTARSTGQSISPPTTPWGLTFFAGLPFRFSALLYTRGCTDHSLPIPLHSWRYLNFSVNSIQIILKPVLKYALWMQRPRSSAYVFICGHYRGKVSTDSSRWFRKAQCVCEAQPQAARRRAPRHSAFGGCTVCALYVLRPWPRTLPCA